MKRSLGDDVLSPFFVRLQAANRAMLADYPGESGERQPIHTVYGGAHLFKRDLAAKLGRVAMGNLERYGGTPEEFAEAVGLVARGDAAVTVRERVVEKLQREPVEDFRIDFEDGYGVRVDDEEDGHAVQAAAEAVEGVKAGTMPPFFGIRVKSLSDEGCRRSLRTLDLFVTALAEGLGHIPERFVITLPKIANEEQVRVAVEALRAIEHARGLPEGCLKLEFMIELTQTILGADGSSNLPRFLAAAQGRCSGAHFGTYDYTASCNITASKQNMRHPACDFAKHMMVVAYGSRGIGLSDGATNIMPVPVHRGKELSAEQEAANRKSVHDAWRLHVADIRHSLENGFYQGWDLHPAQLPTRYAAVYDFFLEGLPAASERLTNFIGKAAQATLVGDVFDDAATGQGLLNFFLRGISSGAFDEKEALATGLTMDQLRRRTFQP